jgi:phenylacetate-CoA ligase
MNLKGEKTYERLPVLLQNLACSFYGWRERKVRMGDSFWQRYTALIDSDRASSAEISSYQDEQVHSLIRHAYETVPYYRRVMDERGLKPADFSFVSDLKKLPILHKEDIVRSYNEFVSRMYNPRKLRIGATSGTTGTALKFATTNEAVAYQWAVWWRHRYRFGIEPLSWHLNFMGKPVVPITQDSPPYWRWNWPMRQALVNMQHLVRRKISAIAAFVEASQFDYYTGYPSIVSAFCDLLNDDNIQLQRTPTHVFLGAENIQEFQRTSIKRATGALISDQYGVSEGCANASRCEKAKYHEDWEFCVLERGDPEAFPNGKVRGRIIATGFANRAFPFIRYDVGDAAIWEDENTRCVCGRASAVISSIDGRNEDFVITPEGTKLMRFDYLFKDTSEIKEAQVVQMEVNRIVIRLVARMGMSKALLERIRRRVRHWISPSLHVDFDVVDEIPRGVSGKFQPVVSELPSAIKRQHHSESSL